MREIKFRGKTVNGEWVYGDLLRVGGGCLIYFGSKTETATPSIPKDSNVAVELFNDEIAVVIPDTIGQYAGLKDKDGKEIYEGDIVRIDCHPWLDWKELDSVNAEFVFDNFGWNAQWKNPDAGEPYSFAPDDDDDNVQSEYVAEMLGCLPNTIEVIGNIHSNPELLKSE